jgi:medium-chain acyl-[acyl-carrier-protein] hydrolase
MESTRNATVGFPNPNPGASLRLFCFPYGGAGASRYRSWSRILHPSVEVCPVQLPGREDRFSEPAFTALPELIDVLVAEIRPHLNKPFAFFGHSMGALVSFELARALRRQQAAMPAILILSAYPAPHLPRRRIIHDLEDEEFMEALKTLSATPNPMFENEELIAFVLPALRADFAVCDTYEFRPEPPLDLPFAAFGGTLDEWATPEEIDAWSEHTNSSFSRRMVEGDHFFVESQRDEVLVLIRESLGPFI